MCSVEYGFPVLHPFLQNYTVYAFDGAFAATPLNQTDVELQRLQRECIGVALTPGGAHPQLSLQRGRLQEPGVHPGPRREIDLSTLADAAYMLGPHVPGGALPLFEVLSLDPGPQVSMAQRGSYLTP